MANNKGKWTKELAVDGVFWQVKAPHPKRGAQNMGYYRTEDLTPLVDQMINSVNACLNLERPEEDMKKIVKALKHARAYLSAYGTPEELARHDEALALINKKAFFGMEYPFDKCARPVLLKEGNCVNCSVRKFCEAPEKVEERG